MKKYCITWNSEKLITTKIWRAETVGEAIDLVLDEELGKWGGIPISLDIVLSGEGCQKK